jgi:integrating conjugative element membrane protein (TIGR03747 family)
MAETNRGPPRRETEQGVVGSLFAFIAKGAQWLLLALVCAVILEWVGMIWWWRADGIHHSRRMLEVEQAHLGTAFRRHLVSAEPVRFANGIGLQLSHAVFTVTRLNDVIGWATTPPSAAEARPKKAIRRFVNEMSRYLIAAEQILRVFGSRLAILILATPVFGLCGLVAIVDGLVRRDLRRWGGGRESGFLYHWAKRVALPLAVAVWLVYLVIPISLHPSFIILPFATLLGLAITATVGTFKKYL